MYSEFREYVKRDGLARQNRFFVNITVPAISGSVAALFSQNAVREVELLTRSVSIPGVNVATGDVRTTGEIINAPYDRNFGGAQFVFYVDRQMIVRKFFDDWISAIQNPDTRTMGWYDQFTSPQITVNVVPRNGNGSVYKIHMYECFPKTQGELTLDQGNNETMLLNVSMEYRYYKTEIVSYVPASGASTGSIGEDMIEVDPIQQLLNNYTNVYDAYGNDFIRYQSSLTSGQEVFSGVSVPQNFNQVNNVLRDQLVRTVRTQLVG